MSPRETTVPSIALVVTVRDEAAALPDLLAGIAAQTVTPAEVVIADGGSTDGTRALLAQWASPPPLRVLDAPGGTIAAGRNLAIAAASAEWIAVTDAGVRLDPTGWRAAARGGLRRRRGQRVLRRRSAHDASSARWAPPCCPRSTTSTRPRFCRRAARCSFRRAAWAAAGGYPEWLDYCEDLVFDLGARAAGCRVRVRAARVAWFRPRSSLASILSAVLPVRARRWQSRLCGGGATSFATRPICGAAAARGGAAGLRAARCWAPRRTRAGRTALGAHLARRPPARGLASSHWCR